MTEQERDKAWKELMKLAQESVERVKKLYEIYGWELSKIENAKCSDVLTHPAHNWIWVRTEYHCNGRGIGEPVAIGYGQ